MSSRATRRGLERLEPTSAGRHRPQRAVRLAVHAPPDRNRLPVQKVLPVALADWRIGHLPKGDARRALAWMNPSPVRREWRRVRGEVAACSTAGTDNLRRHRTTAVLRLRGNATKFAITDLHDLVRAPGRCPNVDTLGVGTGRARMPPNRVWGARRPDLRPMTATRASSSRRGLPKALRGLSPPPDDHLWSGATSPRRRPGCAARRTCGRGPCSGLRRCTSRSRGSRPEGALRSRWRPPGRHRAGSRRCRTYIPRG